MIPTGAVSTASDNLPPELVDRFRAALDRLNPEAGRIGLAVSGGPDSMAMMLLVHAAIPGQFEVATVNHGLRPEAKDECALVVAACEDRGIPCDVLTVKVGQGNLQAEARKARYEALSEWSRARDLAAFATAHHANDQAETLLMRLNRGSGVAGLAGIRERLELDEHGGGVLIRPLLEFSKAELQAVVDAASLVTAQDPSNANADFERVGMRQALEGADWLNPVSVARSARNLDEADEAVRWAAKLVWEQYVTCEGEAIRYRVTGPREIRLRTIGRAIDTLGGKAEGSDIARLLDRLQRGEGGNVGGVLVTTKDGEWIFRPEPARRTG